MKQKIACMVILCILFAGGCGRKPVSLGTNEIQDYQGQKLTLAADLPENSIKGPPTVDIAAYRLQVYGLVNSPLSYSYEEVLHKTPYTKLIVLHCVEGWDADILWEGVKISDLIEPSQIQPQCNTVIFHAADGYTTSLPLDYIRENNILLAYKENGQVLPATLGYPFIVVAENKLGYKWARWVAEIELSDNPDYRGYWEQRGYSNQAEVK